jgi:hypothetical protein
MLTDYMAFIVAFIALLTLMGLGGVWRKPGILPEPILTLGTATTLLGLPPAGHALQIIQEEKPVIIEATRTIDDTLIITAQEVTVHGNRSRWQSWQRPCSRCRKTLCLGPS